MCRSCTRGKEKYLGFVLTNFGMGIQVFELATLFGVHFLIFMCLHVPIQSIIVLNLFITNLARGIFLYNCGYFSRDCLQVLWKIRSCHRQDRYADLLIYVASFHDFGDYHTSQIFTLEYRPAMR